MLYIYCLLVMLWCRSRGMYSQAGQRSFRALECSYSREFEFVSAIECSDSREFEFVSAIECSYSREFEFVSARKPGEGGGGGGGVD